MLHFLHWCYTFCTGVTLFALVLHLNCTALSQSESSNFFMYIINVVTFRVSEVVTFCKSCYNSRERNCYILRQKLLHFGLVVRFSGVTRRFILRHAWDNYLRIPKETPSRNMVPLTAFCAPANSERKYCLRKR